MSTASIAAAATIVASPSIAVADASAVIVNTRGGAERLAAERLSRAEQMIETLRTRYIARDWKFDEAAGERMLRFFRSAVRFPQTHEAQPGYEDEWTFVIRFVGDHGQSLDWLISGDVRGLICGAASRSCAALQTTVDPILAAIEDHCSAIYELFELLNSNHNDDDSFEERQSAAHEKMDEKAIALTNIQPTTMDGIVALLTYVNRVNTGAIKDKDGGGYTEEELWPCDLHDDAVKNPRGRVIEIPFPYWVMENIRAAISEIRAAA